MPMSAFAMMARGFSDLAGAFQCEVHRFIDYAIAVGVNAGEVCDEIVHVGEYESCRFA